LGRGETFGDSKAMYPTPSTNALSLRESEREHARSSEREREGGRERERKGERERERESEGEREREREKGGRHFWGGSDFFRAGRLFLGAKKGVTSQNKHRFTAGLFFDNGAFIILTMALS